MKIRMCDRAGIFPFSGAFTGECGVLGCTRAPTQVKSQPKRTMKTVSKAMSGLVYRFVKSSRKSFFDSTRPAAFAEPHSLKQIQKDCSCCGSVTSAG